MLSTIMKPTRRRRAEFIAAVARSRRLHRGLVSPPDTVELFDHYIDRLRRQNQLGYWVRTPDDELAGVIHVSEIVRGVFQSAYLGYYVFEPHDGQALVEQPVH